MPSRTKHSTADDQDRSHYFYDMLDQLLIIGRLAGGEALVDATLISGLIATRKAQERVDQAADDKRSA